ncbi:MAG: ArsI/CadI family heavy metal resistance metalloenzyme [Cyanobacteria bacterium P01_G01_bin.19]
MSRLQLALNVSNLEESISFYTKLFGVEPAKVKPGYANFAIAEPPLKLVLMENSKPGGTINHLGVEVEDTEAVELWEAKVTESEMNPKAQKGNTCCYAKQDKFWVADPDSAPWEIYTVLENSASFGENVRPDLTASNSSKCCS